MYLKEKFSKAENTLKKDNSPHDDYCFSFNEKDIDIPQGPTPYIMEEINGRKFGCIHIPGDGDCFFHCLSMALHRNLLQTSLYREQICNYIAENWNMYEYFVANSHSFVNCTLSNYKKHMLQQKGWATACEIQVACHLLNIHIDVWLKGSTFGPDLSRQSRYHLTQYSFDNGNERSLHLLLFDNHFELLIPLQKQCPSFSYNISKTNHSDNSLFSNHQPDTSSHTDKIEQKALP